MKTSKKVLLNSGYLYARMIITILISLNTTRIILNELGSSDFGLYNLLVGVTLMLTFINTTLSTSSQRFMSHAQGENNFDKQVSIFNISLFIHTFAAFFILIILCIFSAFIFDGFLNIDLSKIYSAKIVYYNVIIITILNIASVPFEACINAHEDMFFFSLLGFVEVMLKYLSALLLSVITFDKLIVYSVSLLLIALVLFLAKLVFVMKKYPETKVSFAKNFDSSLFKEMVLFSSWGGLTSTVSLFTNYGRSILINMFFGTKVNAAQGISGQVIGQVGAITNVFLRALNPIIFKSEGAKNNDLFIQSIKSGSKLAFLLFSLVGIPVIFEMEYLFEQWLKIVPPYAVSFCKLSMVTFILGQLTITVEPAIYAKGNIKKFSIIKFFTDIIPFVLIIISFKIGLSPISMYVIYLMHEVLRQGISLYFANKLCGINIKIYIMEIILKPIIISLIVILCIFLIQQVLYSGWFRVIFIFIFSSIFTLILYYYYGFSRQERLIIDSIIAKVRSKINFYLI